MKTKYTALLITLLACAAAFAQEGKPPRGHRPPPPVIAVLDADKDGKISAEEIANASAALKTLDENGDGELTRDELRPAPPEGKPDGPGKHHGPPPQDETPGEE